MGHQHHELRQHNTPVYSTYSHAYNDYYLENRAAILERLKMFRILVILTIFSGFIFSNTACNRWERMEGWNLAALSDDGSSVAIIREYYMGQNTITHIKKKEVESQIQIGALGATVEPTPLTDRMQGYTKTLYYMASENYIITNRYRFAFDTITDGDCVTQKTQYYSDIVRMDGSVTSIDNVYGTQMVSHNGGQASSAAVIPLEVIPSPDGSMLAQLKGQQTCETRTATLTFLNSNDLSVIDGPISILGIDADSNMGSLVDYGWLETGEFFVGTWGAPLLGNKYLPNQAPVASSDLLWTCIYPKTTSVSFGYYSGNGAIEPGTEPTDVFGCNPE